MSPLWTNTQAWVLHQHLLFESRTLFGKKPRARHLATAATPLLAMLPAAEGRGVHTLTLQLGMPWVRYLTLPWQDGLWREKDWQGYARVCFSQQFGGAAGAWRVSVSPSGYGLPRLAAAIEQTVYTELLTASRAKRYRIQAIAPLLNPFLHHHRPQYQHPEFVLILCEAEHVTFLFWKKPAWLGVITLPFPTTADAWVGRLNEAAILVGVVLPRLVLLAGYHLPESIALEGCDTRRLKTLSPPGDWRHWPRAEGGI